MRDLTGIVLIAVVALLLPIDSAEAADRKIDFHIDAQELGSGLREFARQADLEVLYEQRVVEGLETSGVEGAPSAG